MPLVGFGLTRVFHFPDEIAAGIILIGSCSSGLASMAGIVYLTKVTTAAGRDNLLEVGGLLFLASALHNAAGYGFGYRAEPGERAGQELGPVGRI